jgi:hypothetical protein
MNGLSESSSGVGDAHQQTLMSVIRSPDNAGYFGNDIYSRITRAGRIIAFDPVVGKTTYRYRLHKRPCNVLYWHFIESAHKIFVKMVKYWNNNNNNNNLSYNTYYYYYYLLYAGYLSIYS